VSGADIILLLAGLITIAAGLIDIFVTVLHYEGNGLLSSRVTRVGWSLGRRLTLRLLPGREYVLSVGGPSLILATIVTWVGLGWIGFALVYASGLDWALVAVDGRALSFLDALYFSAVALSTVGFGEIYAIDPFYQLMSAFEALAGFSILTLVIAYLLGVYGVVRDQSILASAIDDQTDGAADPLALAEAWLDRDVVAVELHELHRELLGFHEGLHRYPVVYYFRRGPAHRSLPYLLSMLGEAAASMRWCLPANDPVAQSPSLAGLLVALRRITGEIADRFVHRPADQRSEPADAQLRARFERACDRLAARGGATDTGGGDDDRDERFAAWLAFVREVDDFARASARDLAYGPAEVVADIS
jgi:hypothetical protein